MRYPTLTASVATAYVDERRAVEGDGHSPVVAPVIYAGSGTEASSLVEEAIREFREEFAELRAQSNSGSGKARLAGQARDGVEGRLSSSLYVNLRELAAEVLTDPGFWRYLGCVEMFDFVKWRDGDACKLESFGAGSSFPTWDCVPLRMFVRARICAESSSADFEDVAAIAATDLWRSHILRVKNGNAPDLSVALAKAWQRGDVDTDSVRDVAKALKRLRSNVIFEVLDAGQAEEIVNAEVARVKAIGSPS